MKKNYIIILFTAFISVFYIGCGLPSYNVVEPPIVNSDQTSDEPTYVGFIAPDDSNIAGYEIYYKIYRSIDTNTIDSDREQFAIGGTNDNYEFGKVKPVRLGFHRLMKLPPGGISTNTPPGFPYISSTDLAAEWVFRLLINPGSNIMQIQGSEIGKPLRDVRIDGLEDGDFKSFDDLIENIDSDSNGVSEINELYSVSFIAFSYISSMITTNESSYPVFLGTFTNITNQ